MPSEFKYSSTLNRDIMTDKLNTIIMVGVMLCSGVAWANNTAKIHIAQSTIKQGGIERYASPTLKQLINKANKIQYQIDPDLGCEVVSHYYLGYGNERVKVTKMQAQVLNNGVTRVTWVPNWGGGSGEKQTVDFYMGCTNNKCTIDNIKNISDGEVYDFKKDLQYIVNHNTCQWTNN